MAVDHVYLAITGIIGLVILESVALMTGHDGQILLAVVAAVSGLAGAGGGIALKTWAKEE